MLPVRGRVVKGSGALIAGADQRNVGAVRLLLGDGEKTAYLNLEEMEEYGAYDGSTMDAIGTALYVAARGGNESIADATRDKGASTGFRDRKGILTADLAKGRRRD